MKAKTVLMAGLLIWGATVAGWGKSKPSAMGTEQADHRSAGTPLRPALECDDNYLRGDFSREHNRDREDINILLNCLFVNPRGPYCLTCVGDMNCDERLTQADASLLIFLVGIGSTIQIDCSPPLPEEGGQL